MCGMQTVSFSGKVVLIEKAANDVFTEGHSTKILKSIKEIIDRFSKRKNTVQSSKDKLYTNKQLAIHIVKQTRKTIDNQLDKIEAAAYEEIDRVIKAEMKRVEDQLHVCDVSIVQLQKQITKLEREMLLGDKESEFITINNVTKEIKRECDLLKDIIEENCDIDFSFEQSSSIGYITNMMSSFGKTSVTIPPASQSDSGTVAIYTGELKLRTTTDTAGPWILSYEMLPDRRQLLADCVNKKLKLYDSKNQFISELVLPDTPFGIVLLSDNEAVVSLPDVSSLQYITIRKNITLTLTKKVYYKPVAMVKYGDDILATVRDRFCKVALIDRDGNIKRTIYQDNGSHFSKPCYIAPSVDQKTVYVADQDKGCVGLSMDGNVMFQHQDQKVKLYGGLAVSDDCVYICVGDGNLSKVRRLSSSGDAEEELDLVNSMPLKIKENNLIIFTVDGKGNRLINFLHLL